MKLHKKLLLLKKKLHLKNINILYSPLLCIQEIHNREDIISHIFIILNKKNGINMMIYNLRFLKFRNNRHLIELKEMGQVMQMHLY